ncbi:protein lin-9 homolog [Tetranychus urticae]|uniref:DIRP domain-containing protein n=1 Tax=Tetranychus urticae TaxID=32264 RepID=T1KFJ4_TETUR|nr:protein lin-9 homolog [Tetranychus urticae]
MNLKKKKAQEIGLRLRTLLKLPKAHKWVCYECFYGNIDQPLFLGKNDFQICLEETFPHLKTRSLKRAEWSKIRRMMGKPRRCSEAFFAEERNALNLKRKKIRILQSQKVVDIEQFRDLPENIPLSLVIGAKVTAILRKPQEGLFMGIIDAVDMTHGMYRITFDRHGIGTHSVPDYEVISNDPPTYIALSSFQSKVRPRLPMFASSRFLQLLGTQVAQALNDRDPLLSSPVSPSQIKQEPHFTSTNTNNYEDEGTLGGFPIKFLALLVRLTKILNIKKRTIFELKAMNTEAEKMRSLQDPITRGFKKQYAHLILTLEKLNISLDEHLKAVQHFTAELFKSSNLPSVAEPNNIKEKHLRQAKDTISKVSSSFDVKSEASLNLITELLGLMLQLKSFAEIEVGSQELQSLENSLKDAKKLVNQINHSHFESQAQVPIAFMQSSLSHLGNLGAFAESATICNNLVT